MPHLHNLIEKTFCLLTVIKRVKRVGAKEGTWLCRCSCGNTIRAKSWRLTHGLATRCYRCARVRPIDIGSRFGMLVVVERLSDVPWPYGDRKRLMTQYRCKCDCGKNHVVEGFYLTSGHSRSCGCMKARKMRPDSGMKDKFRAYKASARRKGLGFELSLKQFHTLTSSNCHYCGRVPSAVWRYRFAEPYTYNGIDRKNNTIGYTEANSVACCHICNDMKKAMGYEPFLQIIAMIYQHRVAAIRKEGKSHDS